MKVGDLITATWPDGVKVSGYYARTERGYVILLDQKTRTEVPCSAHSVHFEMGDTMEEIETTYLKKDESSPTWVTVAWGIFIGLIIGKWWWG